jgi:hypothetical protein
VDDTPVEQDANDADDQMFWKPYKRDDLVAKVCKPLDEGRITRERANQLLVELKIDSCPQSSGADNVFNYMSYAPDLCQRDLTKGQVKHLQEATSQWRPKLYQKSLA